MIFLALKHLLSKKRQTALILFGVVLGTTAFVAISGMMLGFQTFIIDQLVNNDAHIRIKPREDRVTPTSVQGYFWDDPISWQIAPSGRRDSETISNIAGWAQRLEADPRVNAYSPQLVLQALVGRGKISQSVRLIGSDPEKQRRVTSIDKYMLVGKFSDLGHTGNRLIIGQPLLDKIGARVSESVLISTGQSSPTAFKIVGSFLLGVKSIDESTVFASLADAQKINKTPSEVSEIAVRLNEVQDSAELANAWSALTSENVQSWDQSNANILSVFTVQDLVRNFMTISILLVAGFGIYNVLNMMVSQKHKEIAILRSIGFEAKDVLFLFFLQGMAIGILGGFLGDILGFFVCKYMSTLETGSGKTMGTTGTMLVSFLPSIYIKGFFLAFGAATVASILPARSAAKLKPIEIIRSAGS